MLVLSKPDKVRNIGDLSFLLHGSGKEYCSQLWCLQSSQWHLSEVGRAPCALLADQLATYVPDVLISSSEPKAFETAHLVAQRMHMSVQVVDGLQEHDRSATLGLGPEEFDRPVAAFFHHPAEFVLGCETAQKASEYFTTIIVEVSSRYAEQNSGLHPWNGSQSLCCTCNKHGTVRLVEASLFAIVRGSDIAQFEVIRVVEKLTLTPPAAEPVTGGQ